MKYPGIEYIDTDVVIFQRAAKYVGFYAGEIDNKPGPLTRSAAEKILPIILQILSLQDPRELQAEITQLKGEMQKVKNIINKW